ncbi:hypothetical protein [Candidatus Competibacter phosphatis]|nr:hypothetical protein [Candidatus Competibacter phosphatis]
MATEKQRAEIDNHTMKFIVGIIAISLAYLTEKIRSKTACFHQRIVLG